MPDVSTDILNRLASQLPLAVSFYGDVHDRMLSPMPASLGCSSNTTQSSYYIGNISKDDLNLLEIPATVLPENTRVRNTQFEDLLVYDILIASVNVDDGPRSTHRINDSTEVRIFRGDRSEN